MQYLIFALSGYALGTAYSRLFISITHSRFGAQHQHADSKNLTDWRRVLVSKVVGYTVIGCAAVFALRFGTHVFAIGVGSFLLAFWINLLQSTKGVA